MSKKCQNDIAKVGEERRRRKRVHRGSFQNLTIKTSEWLYLPREHITLTVSMSFIATG